jgi:hypothetical protein
MEQPKTAAQINTPQTGATDFTPLPPGAHPRLAAAIKAREEEEKAAQAGWWSLRDKRGSVDGIVKAVESAAIPPHWQAAIKAEIANLIAGTAFNFLYLDVHYFVVKGKATLHLTIEPDQVL